MDDEQLTASFRYLAHKVTHKVVALDAVNADAVLHGHGHAHHIQHGFHTIGLRYFNVFGKRQDPDGAYAAVIPKWTDALLKGETVFINGDGETSRDFCFIENVRQINLLAATASLIASEARQSTLSPLPLGEEGRGERVGSDPTNQVYNVAVGDRTTLNQLFAALRDALQADGVSPDTQPSYRDFRAGDVRHSQADIGKAQRLLSFAPTHRIHEGIGVAMPWYVSNR